MPAGGHGDDPQARAHAYACAAAYWSVVASQQTPTMRAIAEHAGLDAAAVVAGRAWLDAEYPNWREATSPPEAAAAVTAAIVSAARDDDTTLATVLALPVRQGALDGLDEPGELEHAPPAPRGPPAWRVAVQHFTAAHAGHRSWDLYADVYSPAADVLFAGGQLDDLIALTVDFCQAITGEAVDAAERKRLAKLVRAYGKAALYGLAEATHRTDTQTVHEYVRYATAVAQAARAKIRDREHTAP